MLKFMSRSTMIPVWTWHHMHTVHFLWMALLRSDECCWHCWVSTPLTAGWVRMTSHKDDDYRIILVVFHLHLICRLVNIPVEKLESLVFYHENYWCFYWWFYLMFHLKLIFLFSIELDYYCMNVRTLNNISELPTTYKEKFGTQSWVFCESNLNREYLKIQTRYWFHVGECEMIDRWENDDFYRMSDEIAAHIIICQNILLSESKKSDAYCGGAALTQSHSLSTRGSETLNESLLNHPLKDA